jgi:pSer/pThr/pTyr-binding forkhead associated (FHA) protein
MGYWFIGQLSGAAHERPDDADAVAVKPWLVWETRQVALAAGENILGRAPDAGVWIDAAGVSRHHARIVVTQTPTIEDLGSKNGTFVRGEAVTKAQPLSDGDQIRLGSVVVTFRIPPPVGSTDSVPPR